MQLWYMHDKKYVLGPYGGFDLKGQSSWVKGQIFKMVQLNWKFAEMILMTSQACLKYL